MHNEGQPTVKDMRHIIIELERAQLRFDIARMKLEQSSDIIEQHEARSDMQECVEYRLELLEQAGVVDIVCRGEAR